MIAQQYGMLEHEIDNCVVDLHTILDSKCAYKLSNTQHETLIVFAIRSLIIYVFICLPVCLSSIYRRIWSCGRKQTTLIIP